MPPESQAHNFQFPSQKIFTYAEFRARFVEAKVDACFQYRRIITYSISVFLSANFLSQMYKMPTTQRFITRRGILYTSAFFMKDFLPQKIPSRLFGTKLKCQRYHLPLANAVIRFASILRFARRWYKLEKAQNFVKCHRSCFSQPTCTIIYV